jgi:hypothetical protein
MLFIEWNKQENIWVIISLYHLYLHFYLYVQIYSHPFVHLSVHPFILLSICLSFCLSLWKKNPKGSVTWKWVWRVRRIFTFYFVKQVCVVTLFYFVGSKSYFDHLNFISMPENRWAWSLQKHQKCQKMCNFGLYKHTPLVLIRENLEKLLSVLYSIWDLLIWKYPLVFLAE